jgi:hypothetical protein
MSSFKEIPNNYVPLSQSYENLEEGQEFKNYAELCAYLNQPVGNKGNSLVSQKENFSRYFEWEQQEGSRKLTITHIYDEPLFNLSDNTLSGLIQKLIADMLAEEYLSNGKKIVIISKKQLFLNLHIVNDSFNSYDKKAHRSLASELNVTLEDIVEFYNITEDKLRKSIDRAFRNLKNRAIAEGLPVKMLYLKNSPSRVATDDERQLILAFENKVLGEMQYKCKSDVLSNNEWELFLSNVVDKLKNRIPNISGYYSAYSIVFTSSVLEESERLEKFLLNDVDMLKLLLNGKVISNSKKSYEDRFDKSVPRWSKLYLKEEFPKNRFEEDKVKFRSGDKYVESGHKLIEKTMLKNTT